mgnify:FL=1
MIEVDNLTHTFRARGDRTTSPLQDVSCTFEDGTINYLLGLNGTGKSTLLGCIAGIHRPTHGSVLIDGRALSELRYPLRSVGSHLSSNKFQKTHSALTHLRWLCKLANAPEERAAELLNAVELNSVGNTPIANYSLGMRQRLGIASVLVGNPRNIILDEPLNGLDIQGVMWLRSLIQGWADEGRCVLIASHHLKEVEATAGTVTVLSQGNIVASGTTTEVIQQNQATDLEQAIAQLIPELGS